MITVTPNQAPVLINDDNGHGRLMMDRDAPSWIFLSAVRAARQAGWTVVSPLTRYSVSDSTRSLYLCRQGAASQ